MLLGNTWYNGYVLIPKGHPMYGVHYCDIHVKVPGGLSFSHFAEDCTFEELTVDDIKCWIVGFSPIFSSTRTWTKKAVQKETNYLKEQLEKMVE